MQVLEPVDSSKSLTAHPATTISLVSDYLVIENNSGDINFSILKSKVESNNNTQPTELSFAPVNIGMNDLGKDIETKSKNLGSIDSSDEADHDQVPLKLLEKSQTVREDIPSPLEEALSLRVCDFFYSLR